MQSGDRPHYNIISNGVRQKEWLEFPSRHLSEMTSHSSLHTVHSLVFLSAPLVTIRVFCYNEGRVYVDGEDVGESNARDLIRYRSQHPRLVAVQCTNTSGSDGAVLVSISDRTLTNNTWRVETSKHDDWMELTYREDHRSNWTVPHVLGTNVEKPNGWPYREGYGDNATWLWTSADTGVRRTTYFRGNLGEYPSLQDIPQ